MYLLMLVYICLVLLRPQDYPQWEESLAGLPILPGTLAIALVFWMFSKHKSFSAPQYPLLLAFFVTMLASQVANGWAGGMVQVVTEFLPIVLAFMLMVSAARTRRRLMGAMATMALCATIMALHGIEQVKMGVGWTGIGLSEGTRIQYVGIFNDPNDLGMLFVACLPMAVFLGYRSSFFSIRRLLWLAVAAILLYGIYLTDSRGTLLGMVVLLGLYVWSRWGLLPSMILGGGALLALMVLLPSRIQELDASEESAQGRIEAWYAGIEMFIENPLFGVATGGFTDYNDLTAHNSFVLVLAETGAIGFTIWIAFIGYCFLMMRAVLRQDEGEVLGLLEEEGQVEAFGEWVEDRKIALTLLISISGFFACAFFLSRSYLVFLYLLLALPTAHYLGMRERWPMLPEYRLTRSMVRWPIIAGCAAIALYVIVKVLLTFG